MFKFDVRKHCLRVVFYLYLFSECDILDFIRLFRMVILLLCLCNNIYVV